MPSGQFTEESFAASSSPTLQERQHMRDQERRLRSEADFTSKVCQTRVSASIHWPSFETRGTGRRVASYCDVALSAIERLCREDVEKAKGLVRNLKCGAGKKRAVSLSGSTLNYAVGPSPSRADHDFVYKYLKKKL